MAAPTVSSIAFDADTNDLTIEFSEAVTLKSVAAEAVTVTDAAGRRFGKREGNGADAITGNGTDTVILPLAYLDDGGGTASSYSIIEAAFQNGALEDSAEVLDEPMYVPLKEVASGLTRTDVQALNNILTLVTTGTLDATAEPQTSNIAAAIDTGTLAALLRAPRNEDRSWNVVDALANYQASSKTTEDLKRLAAAINELAAGLNPRGTFAMKPNGT